MSCYVRVLTGIALFWKGRKHGLTLGIGCEAAQFPLPKVGKDLFRDLKRVAQTLDSIDGERSIRRSVMNWLPVLTILN